MKKNNVLIFVFFALISNKVVSQIEIDNEGITHIDNEINLTKGGNRFYSGKIYHGKKGKIGPIANHTFNNYNDYSGLIIEHGTAGVSGGIYTDSNFTALWNNGFPGYLLKVLKATYSEVSLKWYIDNNGNAYTNSDKRRKENITSLVNNTSFTKNSILKSINKINGVTYEFIETLEETKKRQSSKSKTKKNTYIGFLAQELEQVFPEVVQTSEEGHKFVNYDGLIPVLVEGIKELSQKVEQLEKEVAQLKK